MKKTLFVLTGISLIMTACGGNTEEKQDLEGLEKDLIEAVEGAGLKAEDFVGKIDELLTLEMAAKVAGLPKGEAKKEHNKLSSFESLKYEWKSDRTRTISINGQSLNVPALNTLELSWVKNTTLEQFKHDYHNPTAEELKNAEAAMKQKSKEMNAEGKASKQQTDVANAIAESAMSNFNVEEVPNVGTYAVFVNSKIMGAKSRDLKVFYNGISFTLAVDLKDDSSYNDKKAIETARLIIAEKL